MRLPSGRVLRRVFPSSAILDDVIGFVVSNEKQLAQSTVTLVQVHGPGEGGRREGGMGMGEGGMGEGGERGMGEGAERGREGGGR